ncbi:hypothetical protein RI367_000897 [Sorochytrium milnesiophthora]
MPAKERVVDDDEEATVDDEEATVDDDSEELDHRNGLAALERDDADDIPQQAATTVSPALLHLPTSVLLFLQGDAAATTTHNKTAREGNATAAEQHTVPSVSPSTAALQTNGHADVDNKPAVAWPTMTTETAAPIPEAANDEDEAASSGDAPYRERIQPGRGVKMHKPHPHAPVGHFATDDEEANDHIARLVAERHRIAVADQAPFRKMQPGNGAEDTPVLGNTRMHYGEEATDMRKRADDKLRVNGIAIVCPTRHDWLASKHPAQPTKDRDKAERARQREREDLYESMALRTLYDRSQKTTNGIGSTASPSPPYDTLDGFLDEASIGVDHDDDAVAVVVPVVAYAWATDRLLKAPVRKSAAASPPSSNSVPESVLGKQKASSRSSRGSKSEPARKRSRRVSKSSDAIPSYASGYYHRYTSPVEFYKSTSSSSASSSSSFASARARAPPIRVNFEDSDIGVQDGERLIRVDNGCFMIVNGHNGPMCASRVMDELFNRLMEIACHTTWSLRPQGGKDKLYDKIVAEVQRFDEALCLEQLKLATDSWWQQYTEIRGSGRSVKAHDFEAFNSCASFAMVVLLDKHFVIIELGNPVIGDHRLQCQVHIESYELDEDQQDWQADHRPKPGKLAAQSSIAAYKARLPVDGRLPEVRPQDEPFFQNVFSTKSLPAIDALPPALAATFAQLQPAPLPSCIGSMTNKLAPATVTSKPRVTFLPIDPTRQYLLALVTGRVGHLSEIIEQQFDQLGPEPFVDADMRAAATELNVRLESAEQDPHGQHSSTIVMAAVVMT